MTMMTDGLKAVEELNLPIPYVLLFSGALVVAAVALQWLLIKENGRKV